MTKYYFIKCEHKIEEEVAVIYLWGRNLETQEKKLFKITGFEHYFYILETENVPKIPQIKRVQSGFKSIFGENVKKIIVDVPDSVKDIKGQFYKTFEADVDYKKRFLINSGIRRYFTIPDGKEELNWIEVKGE